MRLWKSAAAGLVSLSVLSATAPALAQTPLIDMVRTGDREAALEALAERDVDVDAAAPDGATALLWATYAVDHQLVNALLAAGADPDATNDFGAAPLTEAVKLGDADLVRMLLDAGADPDSPNHDNQTALMLAANIGNLEIAEMLVERGAEVNAVEEFRGQTALMWAAARNHPDIVDLLIENGADVHPRAKDDDWPRQMTSEPRAQYRDIGGHTALIYATRSGCYRCAVAIVEAGADVDRPNPEGITPLINALDNRSFDIAMYLLDQGARNDNWDIYGRTPLYVAVDLNSYVPRFFGGQNFQGVNRGAESTRDQQTATAMDVVNRLLDEGVDPNHQLTRMRPNGNGRGRFTDYMMRGGTGPLMLAVLSYDTEAIEALLAHGAEVDLRNVFQITPLMAAASMTGTGRTAGGSQQEGAQDAAIETIDLLLEAGADINAQIVDSRTRTATLDAYVAGRDREGQTALHAAAESGWDKVAAHLIERGADPTIADAEGRTPLDVAQGPGVSGPGGGRGPAADANREATVSILQASMAAYGAGAAQTEDL